MIAKLLKLFDCALTHSKKEIVKIYDSYDDFDDELDEMLLNNSIYPNGEKIGFYNFSQYDLDDILELDNFNEELMDYIDSFSDNVNEALYLFNIDEIKKEDFNDLNYEVYSSNDFINIFDSIIGNSYDNFLGELIAKINGNDAICDLYTKDCGILFNLDSNKLYAPNLDEKYIKLRNIITDKNTQIIKDLPENTSLIANLAFSTNEMDFAEVLKNYNSKLIITLSSSFFDENMNQLSNIKNPHNLKAIISLPIYRNDSNLVFISIDADKKSDEFILIDESDSVMHKDIKNWSFIKNELITYIIDAHNDFKEYENALIAPIEMIIPDFKDIKERKTSKKIFENLSSLEDKSDNLPIKNRVITNQVVDEIFKNKGTSVRQEISKSDIKAVELSKMSHKTIFNNIIYGKKRQDMENLLYKNHKKLIDDEIKFLTLGELAILYEITDQNDKDTILISTCKTCNSKIVHYNSNIDDFNGEIYIEINIICKDLLKEYLYVYLNSSNGLDELFYFSKGNEFMRAENIQHARIPLPSKKVQKEIVKAVYESNEFFKSVYLLKKEFNSNILDYKNMMDSINELRGEIEFDADGGSLTKLSRSWQHVYNGLIWPLAISYLSATKGGFENVEKLDKYLILFEFVSAFNFIIMLSGLPDDIYQEFKYDIWDSENLRIYESMTFGKWVKLTENISKIYNDYDFVSKLDNDLFNKISSKKILKTLNKAKDYRNEHAHGAFINSFEAQKIIDKLDEYLEDIFDILEVYSNYKLVYITGKVDTSGGKLKHKVILLNGPCAQPIYEDIIFNELLTSDSLYLYNPKNNKKLLINSDFMKFTSTDDNNKHWALFIYYMCERVGYRRTNAHYKCFQSTEDDIIESISTFKDDIMR